MENKLYPWQKDLLDKLPSGGIKPGEMMVISSGRQMGKSNLTAYLKELYYMAAPYRYLSEATVDGEKWYTVTGQKPVCTWIRTQDNKLWHEHIDSNWNISYNTFDMHEKLYTMLGMKFR
jgi:hypothetical protein